MGFYHPCHNCKLERLPCPRRDGIAASIKGLGLTGVKFRCADRQPLFAVGQRVNVDWIVPMLDGEWDEAMSERWPATVVAERRPKFQILVDDVDSDEGTPARGYIKNESLYAKVTAPKLSARDEAPRAVCGTCQAVLADNGSVTGCYGYEDGCHGYTPTGCLKAATASGTETRQGGDGTAPSRSDDGPTRNAGDAR